MCIACEHMLYEEHRSAEPEDFDPCPERGKFHSNEGGLDYFFRCTGFTFSPCLCASVSPWWIAFCLRQPKSNLLLPCVVGGCLSRIKSIENLIATDSKIKTF